MQVLAAPGHRPLVLEMPDVTTGCDLLVADERDTIICVSDDEAKDDTILGNFRVILLSDHGMVRSDMRRTWSVIRGAQWDGILEDHEDWCNRKFDADDKARVLSIYPDDRDKCAPYQISYDQIDSRAKILSFVHHLSEKNWVTTKIIEQFIELATGIAGVKLYE